MKLLGDGKVRKAVEILERLDREFPDEWVLHTDLAAAYLENLQFAHVLKLKRE